ncbi:MAG: hypothetical protein R2712_23535 [Vicinamibacterales bacterium]
MKIAILSTPKTGNVWLSTLLTEAYGLPRVPVDPSLRFLPIDMLESSGENWLIYAHVYPDDRTVEWLRRTGVHVVSTVRHPGDVLVSLRHYVSWSEHNADDPARALLVDHADAESAALRYVREHFPNVLGISASWIRLGASRVRYRDLLADPMGTMRTLTGRMQPVDERDLRRAVVLSQFHRMKAAVDPKQGLQPWSERHFRGGRTGDWRDEIGEGPVLDVLRTEEPFVTLLEAMGYTFDRDQPPVEPFSCAAIDPFGAEVTFDNGVRICPVMIRAYMLDPEAERRWPDPVAASGAGSYYEWLNAPAAAADGGRAGEALLTNLAVAIYRMRPDVQAAYADIAGAHRLAFAWWFVTYAMAEYRLPPEFAAPIQASFARLAPRLGPAGG